MDLKKIDLKDRIKELEEQLALEKKNTYIHETHHLYCKENKKMQDYYLDKIKEELKEL